MPYVTVADVKAALAPDGAPDQSSAAEMSSAAITREIVRAQAEVDGHLLDRYAVPFADASVPTLVKSITEDIAAYLATLTHRRAGRLDENDVIWLRYSRASALLERLGSGAMDLGGSTAGASDTDPVVINQREFDLFDERELGPLPVYYP